MELTSVEARVLGCLVEKQLTTPQYYPLTLNSLVSACNQTSNRDPVTDYDEPDVAGALTTLREKGVVRVVHSSSNRATKHRHVLDEFWGLDDEHRAVLAVLLLRGPQTLGELRIRTERMARFDSLGEVEEVLRLLEGREEPLLRRLERQPGQKEARYAHLLSGEPAQPDVGVAAAETRRDGRVPAGTGGAIDPLGQRVADQVADLEARVARLEAAMAAMAARAESADEGEEILE